MTATLQAAAQNDPTPNPQIQWQVTAAGKILSNSDFTQYAGDGSYAVGPNDMPVRLSIPSESSLSYSNATVTACSYTDATKCTNFTVSVPAIAVYLSGPLAPAIPATFSIQLSAYEIGDPTPNPQINWSATCDLSNCGSFSPTTTASNGATVYTAPANATAGEQVNIVATDAADPLAVAGTFLQLIPVPANPALPDGNYVFQSFFGPSVEAGVGNSATGVFQVQSGVIYGGPSGAGEFDIGGYTEDQNGYVYPSDGLEQIGWGTISQTADGNLEYSLQPVNPLSSGLTFFGTPLSNGKSFIAGGPYDVPYAGTLEQQSANNPGGGGYAVYLAGGDVGQDPAWFAGVLNFTPRQANSTRGIGVRWETSTFPSP